VFITSAVGEIVGFIPQPFYTKQGKRPLYPFI